MTIANRVNVLQMENVLDAIAQIVRDVDGMREVWCQVDEGRATFPPAAINTTPAALVFYERSVDYSRVAGLERDEYVVSVQILAGPAASLMGASSRLAVQLRQRLLDDMGNHIMLAIDGTPLCTSCIYLPGVGLRTFTYADVDFVGIDMEFQVTEERSRDFYP